MSSSSQQDVISDLLLSQIMQMNNTDEMINLINFYNNKPESIQKCVGLLLNHLVLDSNAPFHPQTNYIFTNPKLLNTIFSLLPALPLHQQLDLLDMFIFILEECLINCALASDVGLVEKILSIITKQSTTLPIPIIQKLIHLIGIIGCHNISTRELKELFSFIRNEQGYLHPDFSPLVLEMIRKMTRHDSPSSFFNFNGKECGLIAENFNFPPNNYSFCTWIRMERTAPNTLYRIFSFFDKKGNGCECLLSGNHMVLQTVISNSKKSHKVVWNQLFHSNRWYFVCLTHARGFFKSEAQFFVDGEWKQTMELKYPPMTNPIPFGHIGTNIPATNNVNVMSFHGQCGPLAFFSNALDSHQVNKLYKCGPDFQYLFKIGDYVYSPFQSAQAQAFQSKLFLLYNPRACTLDRKCLDNSHCCELNGGGINDTSNENLLERIDARMCTGTCVLVSRKVKETLHCIGGVQSLFPLLNLLTTDTPWMMEMNMLARIISLISDLMKHSVVNQQQMITTNGCHMLSHLLCKLHKNHFTSAVSKALQQLLFDFDENQVLQNELISSVYLQFEIWNHLDASTQMEHLLFLTSQFSKLKHLIHVQDCCDVLCIYYSYSHPLPNQQVFDQEEIYKLRMQVLLLMDMCIATHGFGETECMALWRYLLSSEDTQQVVEVLEWMIHSQRRVIMDVMAMETSQLSNEYPFLFSLSTLLSSTQEKQITYRVLQLLAKCIHQCVLEKRNKISNIHGFYLYLEHALFTNGFDDALFTILVNHFVCKPSSNQEIVIPHMMKHVLSMVSMVKQNQEYIQQILQLCKVVENKKMITKMNGWQYWFLPCLNNQQDEMVLECYVQLLSECILYKDGYVQLKDTLTCLKCNHSHLIVLFLKLICNSVFAMASKMETNISNPFWENNCKLLQYMEEVQYMNLDLTELYQQVIMGYDFLIKKSIKDVNTMQILHYMGWDANNSKKKAFSIKTIINIASDLTSTKSNPIPTNTSLFYSLFRMELYLMDHLSEVQIENGKYMIRLLGLLCMDIDHTKVPKITAYNSNTLSTYDNDTHTQRIFYLMAQLMIKVDKECNVLAPVLQSLLRKHRLFLSSHFLAPDVKEFFAKPIPWLDQNVEMEEFLLNYKGDEMERVKKAEPLANTYKAIQLQQDSLLPQQIAKKDLKRRNRILVQIEKESSMDTNGLKRVVNESGKLNQQLCVMELDRWNQWKHAQKRKQVMTEKDWNDLEMRMFNDEIGVWSIFKSKESFVILDERENSQRMRMRLLKNRNGSSYVESSSEMTRAKHNSVLSMPQQEEEEALVILKNKKKEETEEETTVVEEEDWESIPSANAKEQVMYETREEKEDTLIIVPCEMIRQLDVIKGSLEITTKTLYFLEEETSNKNNNKKWSIDQILSILKRRYLFRHTAFEIFFADCTNFFFNFEGKDLDSVVSTLLSLKPPLLKLNMAQFHSNPMTLLKRSKLTEKWQRREISNFEYLMALNTFANRTYNDLTQYPVFPWVIKDYESTTLDLNNIEQTYRDLSKPIGALNKKRLEQILERYNSFIDPNIPKFHYGSHYSSVGTVLYFLIRLEPFTKNNIKMQGGFFDLPDRLFHSIPACWKNIMTSNSDVKELVPEFYYSSEFLFNLNRLPLGSKQNGEQVQDVVLPPWASSAEEFVRINRQALESEYVSAHLHEWIDLIFGFKQQGPAAEKAFNIFYYLTYENNVNIDAIDDPMVKKSIETQISNFGQTPTQLFKTAHPARNKKAPFVRPNFWKPSNAMNQSFFLTQVMENGTPLIYLQYIEQSDRIMIVNSARELHGYNWLKPKASMIMASPIGCPMATDVFVSDSCYVCTKDGRWVFSCGHFDKSIMCAALFDKLQVKQTLQHQKDVVTCMAISEDSKYLVSGSKDATIDVWSVSTKSNNSPLSFVRTLYGHEGPILAVDIYSDLDTVASGDWSGSCILHSLKDGQYIRTIQHPNKEPISLVKIASSGHIIMYSLRDGNVHLFTLNGKLLASAATKDKLKVIQITKDCNYIICGGSNKQVTVRRLNDLSLVMTYEPTSADIRCICFKDELNFVVGVGNGRMFYYALDIEILEQNWNQLQLKKISSQQSLSSPTLQSPSSQSNLNNQ